MKIENKKLHIQYIQHPLLVNSSNSIAYPRHINKENLEQKMRKEGKNSIITFLRNLITNQPWKDKNLASLFKRKKLPPRGACRIFEDNKRTIKYVIQFHRFKRKLMINQTSRVKAILCNFLPYGSFCSEFCKNPTNQYIQPLKPNNIQFKNNINLNKHMMI